jgi:hypothetical protein
VLDADALDLLRLGNVLAQRPQLFRLASDCATTPSLTSPASSLSASQASTAAGLASENSASTYHGDWPVGRVASGMFFRTSPSAVSETISKAVNWASNFDFARFNRPTVAFGESTFSQQVTCVFGSGKSFSTAPVMMPSVPSAPMNSCFRS